MRMVDLIAIKRDGQELTGKKLSGSFKATRKGQFPIIK